MRHRMLRSLGSFVVLGLAGLVAVALTAATSSRTAGGAPAAHGSVPLVFVENRGQTDARVRYYAQGSRYAFYFAPDEIVLSFLADRPGAVLASTAAAPAQGVALRLRFPGRNPRATLEAAGRAPGHVSYLRGNDPARWQTELPAYESIVYRDLWPGIDAVLREQDGRLKYEFRVAPGADPADVRLAYAGADGLALDGDGALVIRTALGDLRDSPPVSWQEVDGKRVPVDSGYELAGSSAYGFAVGDYRRDRELVIDPGLDYSTFLGGRQNDSVGGIAVDGAGNAYVAGWTVSTDFPTTAGAFDRTHNGGIVDVFVTKVAADGRSLVYSTFLGGTPAPLRRGTGDPWDFGRAIAVDAQGHAYVTGQTSSDDFPTTAGAFQRTIATVENASVVADAFVTKLNPSGSGLAYSTFLGGTREDDARGIAVDAAGNAYVFGDTFSLDLPTSPGAFQTARGAGRAGFVSKLNAAGSALVYSTYLGGSDNTASERIAVDGQGHAYVAGATRAQDFPTTPGAFQPAHPGGDFIDLFTAFVTKLNPTGTGLVYSTFLGGTKREAANGLAVDGDGHAYVTGSTSSPEFPTTPGAFDPTGPGSFVVKLAADGSGLVYSTFLDGGSALGIALDADRSAWLAGPAGASAPTTEDAFSREHAGSSDAWIAQLDAAGSSLLYATFVGGVSADIPRDVAVDGAGGVYVAGTTRSFDFPTTQGAFQTALAAHDPTIVGDAFVLKLGDGTGVVNPDPPAPTRTHTFSGRIDKNQTLAHSVSVPARGTVALELGWVESRARLTLRVLSPSGSVVFLDSSADRPKRGSFEATVTGTYRVEIVNTTDRRTDYTLSVTVPLSATTFPAALSLLRLDPASVTGGTESTGTVALTAAAPPEGAAVELVSSNPALAAVPATVTVPAGQTSATFSVATTEVDATATATVSASYGGVTRTATLEVTAQGGPALSTLVLSPTTVDGGGSSTGTVTLTGAAPAGGAVVPLISSNTQVATVPASVTVPAGATSATFTLSTSQVTVDSSSAITASHGGVQRTVILSVRTAAPATDNVTITRLEYTQSKQELRVEASSSSGGATLRAYVTSTDQLIGTLSGGRGEFSWPTNPQSVTVRSSLGGSATRTVTLK